MILGIIGWLAAGLLVGFVVSKFVDLHGDDPILGIGAAVGGALVGAVLYTVITGAGVSTFNAWSLFWAIVGAIVGVTTCHLVRARYVTREKFSRRSSY
jgi:uncharacterized membrane protein YeaQ/YmgE (transglycosylase-associated protein family)